MKIIKAGKVTRSFHGTCDHCGCKFECAPNEVFRDPETFGTRKAKATCPQSGCGNIVAVILIAVGKPEELNEV